MAFTERTYYIFSLANQWVPDGDRHNCAQCYDKLSAFFNPKHHCRMCGNIFCEDCSNHFYPPNLIMTNLDLDVDINSPYLKDVWSSKWHRVCLACRNRLVQKLETIYSPSETMLYMGKADAFYKTM